jgi:ABC-type sugar transport system substrate-binding protein
MHRFCAHHPVSLTAFVCVLLVVTGCQSQVPPPEPPPLASNVSDSPDPTTNAARPIALVLPSAAQGPLELLLWEHHLRNEATRAKRILEVFQPKPEDPPGRQAQMIGDAVKRGSAGLIVVPGPDIADALRQARDDGVPIVLLDKAVSLPGKPIPMVTFVAESVAARSLVDSAQAAANDFHLSAKGPALIVHHDLGNPRAEERLRALESVLKELNIDILPPVNYSGSFSEVSAKVKTVLDEHPGLPIVIATNDDAISPLMEMRNGINPTSRFAVVGYGSFANARQFLVAGICAAVVDDNHGGLARRAFQAMLDRLNGNALPERIEVARPIHHASRNDNNANAPTSRPPVSKSQQ